MITAASMEDSETAQIPLDALGSPTTYSRASNGSCSLRLLRDFSKTSQGIDMTTVTESPRSDAPFAVEEIIFAWAIAILTSERSTHSSLTTM